MVEPLLDSDGKRCCRGCGGAAGPLLTRRRCAESRTAAQFERVACCSVFLLSFCFLHLKRQRLLSAASRWLSRFRRADKKSKTPTAVPETPPSTGQAKAGQPAFFLGGGGSAVTCCTSFRGENRQRSIDKVEGGGGGHAAWKCRMDASIEVLDRAKEAAKKGTKGKKR